MDGTRTAGVPPSLLGITFRRATVSGRFFLVYGTVVSAFLGSVLALVSSSAFASAFPLFLPIFGVVGSMGGLTVFTSDRTKGVLEYLLAYGVSPRRIFVEILLTSLALVTIVVGVAVGVGLGLYVGRGHPVTVPLLLGLGLYGVPMAYACAAFAASAGMYWTALSSPRQGMSSPIGLIPMVGILPALATLGAIIALGLSGGSSTEELEVLGAGLAVLGAVVLALLALLGRLLRRERLLSPA